MLELYLVYFWFVNCDVKESKELLCMIDFFKKPYRWAMIFTGLMIGAFAFVMLDTFVIPKSYQMIASEGDTGEGEDTDSENEQPQDGLSVDDTSYEDDNIKISINTIREYDSNIYIADIQVSDISYLKTAFANNTYGRNIKSTTSDTAKNNNAIFAINGDYYGFRDYGYVLRNGTLYRNTEGDTEDLVIDNSGNFSIIKEEEVSTDELDLDSIWQILSFGPALIENAEIVVDSTSEVSRAKTSNPRTAIGQISPLHYVIVVSDGRTDESEGLSLLQLAEVFEDLGCTTAYNLDGGGSSTMFFNGEIVNVPTDGRDYGEREVSDIVYIGY
jgi:exopolysaccharide biosynthesis protein